MPARVKPKTKSKVEQKIEQPVQSDCGSYVLCGPEIMNRVMPEDEAGPVAWVCEKWWKTEAEFTPYIFGEMASEAFRIQKDNFRMTIFSNRFLKPDGRHIAMGACFDKFDYPSAAEKILNNISWIPVPRDLDRLKNAIRSEAVHLYQAPEADGEPVNDWFIGLWQVEAFGLTRENAAAWLSEAAFGHAAVWPKAITEDSPAHSSP
jgi:hypothetical protein